MWVPAWLGQFYSKIYLNYGSEPFTIEKLKEELNLEGQNLRVLLSRLHKAGYIERRGRGVYSALDPMMIVLGVVDDSWMSRIRQREYIPLIRRFVSEFFKKYNGRVFSVVLFGSVARGEAGKNSDLDFLTVVKGLPESYSERVRDASCLFEELTATKLSLWKSSGAFPNVNTVLLTPEEARVNQPFYLDMVTDSLIIFDRNNFMKNVLSELKKKLEEMGAKKSITPKGDWYWQLKDHVKEGEVIEL